MREWSAETAADVFLMITEAVGADVLGLAMESFGGGDARAAMSAMLRHPKAIGAVAARAARGLRPHWSDLAPVLFQRVHCDRCRLGTASGSEGPADLGGEHERWRDHFAGAEGLRDMLPVTGYVLASNFLTPSEIESLFADATPSTTTAEND